MESIGSRVRALRARRGVTLRALAQAIDVSPATLSQIERGRTSLSVARLTRIAESLQAQVDEIIRIQPSVGSMVDARPEGAGDWRHYPPLTFDAALEAALGVFVEVGYHGATIRDIASRAGLSVAGIYHHYPSKQHLLMRIMHEAMSDLLRRSEAARDEGVDAVERFCVLIENLALFHTHRIRLMVVGGAEQRSLEPGNRKLITELRIKVQRLVYREVEQAVAEGHFGVEDARARARAAVTMVAAIPSWWKEAGPTSPEQTAAMYVRFALDLMRAGA